MTTESNLFPVPCPRCGTYMRPSLVKTAIWVDDRLFVVENIPAQVCDSCADQFYDDDTTDALRRMTEERFPAAKATGEILVPVFSLEGGGSTREASTAAESR